MVMLREILEQKAQLFHISDFGLQSLSRGNKILVKGSRKLNLLRVIKLVEVFRVRLV